MKKKITSTIAFLLIAGFAADSALANERQEFRKKHPHRAEHITKKFEKRRLNRAENRGKQARNRMERKNASQPETAAPVQQAPQQPSTTGNP